VIVAFALCTTGALGCLVWSGRSAWRAEVNWAALYLFFVCSTAAMILALLLWNHP